MELGAWIFGFDFVDFNWGTGEYWFYCLCDLVFVRGFGSFNDWCLTWSEIPWHGSWHIEFGILDVILDKILIFLLLLNDWMVLRKSGYFSLFLPILSGFSVLMGWRRLFANCNKWWKDNYWIWLERRMCIIAPCLTHIVVFTIFDFELLYKNHNNVEIVWREML